MVAFREAVVATISARAAFKIAIARARVRIRGAASFATIACARILIAEMAVILTGKTANAHVRTRVSMVEVRAQIVFVPVRPLGLGKDVKSARVPVVNVPTADTWTLRLASAYAQTRVKMEGCKMRTVAVPALRLGSAQNAKAAR